MVFTFSLAVLEEIADPNYQTLVASTGGAGWFLAQNLVTHLCVCRTARVREVGGFRVGYEGAQDWDLVMRVNLEAYFRLSRAALRGMNRSGRSAVVYLHPWELDPGQPRIKKAPRRRR